MVQLGGYAGVTYVSRTFVQSALDAAWNIRWTDARGAVHYSVPLSNGTSLVADGAFGLDKPSFEPLTNTSSARVGLSAGFRLRASAGGEAAAEVYLQVKTSVDVPVRLSQEMTNDQATADLSGFAIGPAEVQVFPVDGAPGAATQSALVSPELRARLADEIRTRAAKYLIFHLPTDRLWLATLTAMTAATQSGTAIMPPFVMLGQVHVLDEWLALGIDETGVVNTHGDPAGIGPPPARPPTARNSDGVLVVDGPLAQRFLQLNARLAITIAAGSRPNLHPVGEPSVRLADGFIEVTSIGKVDAPAPFPGNFPYHAVLQIKPWRDSGPTRLGATIEPHVTADVPWALELLGDIVDFFGGDVFGKLKRANKPMGTLIEAHASIDIPGLEPMSASIDADALVFAPDHLGVWINASAGTWPETPPAPTALTGGLDARGDAIRARFFSIGFAGYFSDHVASPIDVDPTYLMRYRLTRGSDGALVQQGTVWSGPGAGRSPEVDLWDEQLYLENSLNAELTIERPPGKVLFHSGGPVKIRDLFDRSHPFARYWHWHHYFDFSREPAQEHVIRRSSAIHKTDIRERCKFCDTGTDLGNYVVESLDTLPAPDRPEFRSDLCRYCFPNG